MSSIPPPNVQPPTSLKPVSHYLKVALEHDARDPVISYWARFATVQKSLTIDKSSPDAKLFVITLLEWLEKSKRANAGNEAISVEAAGEAHIENYALKLFGWADGEDRGGVFNKNVVKAFYTAGILFDILESLRPPLSDEFVSARKYSKWKAAYIHNCLKNGETPVPGGREDEEEGEDGESGGASGGGTGGHFGFVSPQQPPPPQDSNYGGGSTIPPPSSYQHYPAPGGGGSSSSSSDNNPYHHMPPPQQPQQQQPPSYGHNNDFGGGGGGYSNPPPPPSSSALPPSNSNSNSASSAPLSFEQIAKAQKYCKWAGSALNFDDVGSAVENLEKALHLLKTGQELGGGGGGGGG